MKKGSIGILGVIFILLLVGYFSRGSFRDAWYAWMQPVLPPETSFQQVQASSPVAESTTNEVTFPFEGGSSTSEHFVLETTPAPKKVQQPVLPPAQMNLAVPFITQAPKGDWGMPFQEACEEAASFMVDQFYQGTRGVMDDDNAQTELLKIVQFEKVKYGFYEDTSATQTARLIQDYFGYDQVIVKPFKTAEDIKQVIAEGHPVIIPSAGRLLHNPYFSNGGPLYHMLVVKGYTPTQFITNDPGLRRKGKEYVYSYETLLTAAHDWNNGDVLKGEKVMIIMMPKKSKNISLL